MVKPAKNAQGGEVLLDVGRAVQSFLRDGAVIEVPLQVLQALDVALRQVRALRLAVAPPGTAALLRTHAALTRASASRTDALAVGAAAPP